MAMPEETIIVKRQDQKCSCCLTQPTKGNKSVRKFQKGVRQQVLHKKRPVRAKKGRPKSSSLSMILIDTSYHKIRIHVNVHFLITNIFKI